MRIFPLSLLVTATLTSSLTERCLAQVVFAEFDGSAWSYTQIDQDNGVGNSLLIDASGNPHVTYATYNAASASGQLRYATRVSGTWTTRSLEGLGETYGNPYINTSLAYNPVTMRMNVLYVSSLDTFYDPINQTYWKNYRVGDISPTGYTSEVVGELGRWYPSEGRYSSLAVSADGTSHISYVNSGEQLVYASRLGDSWSYNTVAAGRVFYSSMRLDSQQKPGIAFYRERSVSSPPSSPRELYYSERTGGIWQTEVVDSSGNQSRVGSAPSLVYDTSDKALIAYTDLSTSVLKYATQNDSGWAFSTVASLPAPYPVVVSSLVHTGTSSLLLFNSGFSEYLASASASVWGTEPVGAYSNYHPWNSLATKADGLPAFVFTAGGAVPEPSTYALAFVGVICGGFTLWRRHRQV